jgi:hypothetical protein
MGHGGVGVMEKNTSVYNMDNPGIKEIKSEKIKEYENKGGFSFEKDGVNIHWSGYEYLIDYKRIETPEQCLQWIEHLSAKRWPNMKPFNIYCLISALRSHFNWDHLRL